MCDTPLRTGIDGYFLDGFHHNHQDSNREGLVEEMKPLINEMLSILPADKARLYHGFCTPLAVLELVRSAHQLNSISSDLTQSGTSLKMCLLHKRTFKVYASCFCWCPGTSAPRAEHLIVSFYLFSS